MSDRARISRKLTALITELRCTPRLEQLEPRSLLAADTSVNVSIADFTSGHGFVCGCPICRGMLDNIPEQAATTGGIASAGTVKSALTAIPNLHSNASARVKIYLDFNGNVQSQWGQWSNVTTPVFDQDGDRTTFTDQELATIREVWARVAEDYSPFGVDVTTQDPGSFGDGQAIRVCIGGNYSDWFGQSAGGVAYVGAFVNSAPNVAYVFSDALGRGNARYVAEAASHEVGHTLGLMHQSSYNGATKSAEYSQGTSAWAPIMGVGYYSQRTTWHNGQTTSSTTYQDDMAIIASQTNGFGYRADDYGGTTSSSGALTFSGTSFTASGIVSTNSDIDVFRFTTSGGNVSLNLAVAQYGADLDGVLELRDTNGNLIVAANPTDQFGASLARQLGAGTYYVMVRSSGGYGNVGQYVLSGSVAGATSAAQEIALTQDGVAIADGGSLVFGSTQTGTAIDRTFTVTNTGGGTLNLASLSSSGLPAGFSLVSNVGRTSLGAGESTTFTLRFQSSTAGTFSGRISLLSNDADEGSYDLNVSGTATAPVSSARIIDDGAAGFTTAGGWSTRSGVGPQNDQRTATPAANASATWTFDNVQAGQQRVAVTWSGVNAANASNARFSVYDNGRLVGSVLVSQRGAAGGFADGGSQWVSLGTFNITSSRVTVVLTSAGANGSVVADAVRIERTGNLAAASRSLSIGGATDPGDTSGVTDVTSQAATILVGSSDSSAGSSVQIVSSASAPSTGTQALLNQVAGLQATLLPSFFSFTPASTNNTSLDDLAQPQDANSQSFDLVFGSDSADDLLPQVAL